MLPSFHPRRIASSLEPLELRIAPAAFYVNGLSVTDQAGSAANDQGSETDAATDGAVDFAFLLDAGDSLVFDVNGDRALDAAAGSGEFNLINVTTGRAMVYFTDLDADMKFDADEITGLAVTSGFEAKINTDIRGSIATTLIAGDPNGDLVTETDLQHSTIDGLTISGRVTGSILAGGQITNVTIGPGAFSTGSSVTSILAGTAVSGATIDFNGNRAGGSFVFGTFVENSAGAEIVNVQLANGATLVRAGDGADGSGSANSGGNVSGLTVMSSVSAMSVFAGNGGDSTNGAGGAGGSIAEAALNLTGTTTADTISFLAGNGGMGAASGGAGGEIVDSSVAIFSPVNSFLVAAGTGGTATDGKGGAGGALTNGVFRAAADIGAFAGNDLTSSGRFDVLAGAGGGSITLDGGSGGAVTNVTVEALGLKIGHLNFSAGDGGLAGQGAGGAGGEFTRNSALVTGQIGSNGGGDANDGVIFSAGDGGSSGASNKSAGGTGGSITRIALDLTDVTSSLEFDLGRGGDGGTAGGAGGSGGSATDLLVNAGRVNTTGGGQNQNDGDFLIQGGGGGNGGLDAAGGRAGHVSAATINLGRVAGELRVRPDDAGSTSGTNSIGKGGSGGAVTGVDLTIASAGWLDVGGSDGGSGKGAGSGGSVTAFSLVAGDIGSSPGDSISFLIAGGAGGAGQNGSPGGKGGAVIGLSALIDDVGEAGLAVLGGDGGSGSRGGVGGAITGLMLDAGTINSDAPDFTLRAGRGGDGDVRGGKGGPLSSITATITGINDSNGAIDGTATIAGGNGGNVTGSNGVGGAAGNLAGIIFTAKGAVESALEITAGQSGDSADATSRKGGGIKDLTVQTYGEVSGNVDITGGAGGRVIDGTGLAGTGGDLKAISYTSLGPIDGTVRIAGGAGGSFSGDGAGSGGNGGKLDSVLLQSFAEILGSTTLVSGAGGNAAGMGDGGDSGKVSAISIKDSYGAAAIFYVAAGAGGNGAGIGSKGGHTGTLGNILLDGVASIFGIGRTTATQNAGSGDALGGDAGDISGVSGIVGQLFITAPDGGAATGLAGKGGVGGDVSGVAISGVGDFVRLIAAGDGGAGGANGVGGAGGGLGDVKVAGDIGDFTSAFDFSSITTGQGGLAAGQGGTGGTLGRNGGIVGVTADRIAAIIAGKASADALTAANAVFSFSGITAFSVGADVNGNGLFTFTDLTGTTDFELGDTPIDGLVLVRTGGASPLPIPTLKLVTV